MVRMKTEKIILFVILSVFALSFVSAWDFYGYAYDVNGTALYNATINITFWTMEGGDGAPTLVGSNSSTSNATTGWFNFSVYENSSYFYKPVIRHFEGNKTDGSTPIDLVGQSLPWFPFGEFNDTTDLNFYLRQAGTINITILNRTGDRDYFHYQVKDNKLGYPVEEQWDNLVSEAVVYLPRDRNYSIMVYPNESMPVSFNWNNFSATSDYNIGSLSSYNATTHTLHKQFNCTDDGVRVSGYIKNSTGQSLGILNEFTVVPYLLEAGNMVYLGQTFPYNMSFGSNWNSSDSYNLTSGFYNISLPGANETSNILLFATARNDSNYYGGFRNLTLNYSSPDTEINFTMYALMGTDWNSSTSNITMEDFAGEGEINISTAKQAFNLVNASNPTQILPNINAHIEITVDYSNYNATEFTFMMDIDDDDNGTFYLPLINTTVKEMNIYSNDYAPKRVATMTAAEILANNNITIAQFNPGDIDGTLDEEDIFIEFYKSNSDCDVPNPPDGCQLGGFGPSSAGYNQSRENFSPLSVIIGGGKMSFRMGYGDISVHYVNVDMLASGPPDMAFEDDAGDSDISTSFENAMKFGSIGPTIYDYVLVSMPYTQGSSSQTGLNEEEDVNMGIPLLYDESWDVIWDTTVNGTNATFLAGNYSHYLTSSSEWETLMGNNTCIENVSNFNSTNPCYIDTANDKIWIRLPHFSGTAPTITGYLLTATEEEDDTTDTGGSSGFGTFKPSKESLEEGYSVNVIAGQSVQITYGEDEKKNVEIKSVSGESNTITVSVGGTDYQVVLNESCKIDLDNDGYYDLEISGNKIYSNGIANLEFKLINEEITSQPEEEQKKSITGKLPEIIKGVGWYVYVIIGLVIIGIVIYLIRKRSKLFK